MSGAPWGFSGGPLGSLLEVLWDLLLGFSGAALGLLLVFRGLAGLLWGVAVTGSVAFVLVSLCGLLGGLWGVGAVSVASLGLSVVPTNLCME